MKYSQFNRRQVLQGLAVSGCASLWGAPVSGAAKSPLDVQKLTSRLHLISGAGGNVVLYSGEDASTLIDTGSRGHANDLISLVSDLNDGKPVTTVFNTHWHGGHTGGNEVFKAEGARILAHENTRLWMTADFDIEWRGTSITPRPAAALPDETFYFSGQQELGNESIDYLHYVQAHTDGDLAMHFPDSNVLVTGGLLKVDTYPICDTATGGWIGGLIPANEAMLALCHDDTIIVPDQGPAVDKSALQKQHDMLVNLYELMKELARKGYSGQDMLDEGITKQYDTDHGDPTEFVLETYRGMWAHSRDMGGFI